MPTLRILTPDGQMKQMPIPEGMNPTPEEISAMVREAGIRTTTVTKEQPDAASTSGKPAGTPTTPGEAMNKSLSSIYRAVADRTVDPMATILSMDPKVGTMQRLGAEVQLAGTVGAAPFAAAGAGMQAASEAAGLSPGTARMVGSATEIGAGLFNLGRSIWSARGRAREVIGAVKRAFQPARGMGRAEQIGEAVQGATREHFADLNRTLGGEFNRLEAEIVRQAPTINPGTSAYGDAEAILQYVNDAQASAGPRADALIRKISRQMHPANPQDPQEALAMRDLIALRKILHERAGVANVFDPDASVVGKKAAEMRDITLDVIRSGSPPPLAAEYDMVRNAWRTQLVEPETFLKGLTRDNVTPLSAFKALFATDDPQRLRVVSGAIGSNPKVAAKLRMGFAEAMTDVLQGEATSKTTLKRLENFRPLLEHAGLYTPREMDDLKFLLESNRIPSLVSELTSSARSSQVMLRGALGASMATHISSHPATLLVSAVAFGGIPQLRRAAMLPEGSAAQRQLMAIIARNIASGMTRLFAPPTDEPGVRGSRAAVR